MLDRVELVQRRRHRGGSPVTSVSFLQGNISGGDATILGLYEATSGITQASNLVSQWDDARGAAGFGPSLTASGSAKPTWDGVNMLVSGDAVAMEMTTAADAKFDLSNAISLCVVGVFPNNASGGIRYAASICNATTPTKMVAVATPASSGNIIQGVFFPDPQILATLVATGASRRLAISTKTAGTTITTQVASQAAISGTISANPATGNNRLSLFTFFTGSGNFGDATVRAVVVLNRVATAGDLTALSSWATSFHGAILA